MFGRILDALLETAVWLLCIAIAVGLAITGWGQPVLAGIATVPVLEAVDDPYAKIVLSTVFFAGFFWLVVNFAEIAVLCSFVQVRMALRAWRRYVDLAEWEREEDISYAPVQE